MLLQRSSPRMRRNTFGVLGKVDGGLTGGVAATDQHDVGVAAHLGLVRCGRVINPAAFETFATFHAEAAILGAGGDKQALGDDGLAAFQSENGVGLVEAQLDHGRGNGDARAELVRLQDGAIGQFAAGNAGGKSQIIFDPHAAAGLAARRGAFQDDRVQSFGGAIDRGGQPAGPEPTMARS